MEFKAAAREAGMFLFGLASIPLMIAALMGLGYLVEGGCRAVSSKVFDPVPFPLPPDPEPFVELSLRSFPQDPFHLGLTFLGALIELAAELLRAFS